MTEARQSVNSQKLDVIISKLDKLDDISERVDKLYHVVIEGNGKPPLTERVNYLERITAWGGKAFWGVFLIVIGAIGVGIVRLIQLGGQ